MRVNYTLFTLLILVATTLTTTAQTTTTTNVCDCANRDYTDLLGNYADDSALRIYTDQKTGFDLHIVGNLGGIVTAKKVIECLSKAPSDAFTLRPNGETLRIEPNSMNREKTYALVKNLLLNEFQAAYSKWLEEN